MDRKVKQAGSERRMELLGVSLQEEPDPELLLGSGPVLDQLLDYALLHISWWVDAGGSSQGRSKDLLLWWF